MRCGHGIALILAVMVGGTAVAQSLGEVAAREKRRREAQKKPGDQDSAKEKGKTFTDEDLQKYSGERPLAEPAAESPASPADGAGNPAPSPSPTRTPSPSDDGKRQAAASIRTRLAQCQASLTSARAALKTAEEETPTVSYPAGFPIDPREARQRVQDAKDANVKEAKARIESNQRRCDDIEDEARKQGIPPGWIR